MANQRRVGAPENPNHLGVVIDAGAGPLDLIAPGGINSAADGSVMMRVLARVAA